MTRWIRVLLAASALLLAAPVVADEATGKLHLGSRPPTQVFIDDVPYGSSDDTRLGLELPPGTYRVRFVCEHEDCEEFERRSGVKTLEVEAGKETRYVADFFALNQRGSGHAGTSTIPDPGPHPATEVVEGDSSGQLILAARPACDVEIDGVRVGTTETTRKGLRLKPGTYRIRFICSGEDCEQFARRSGVKTLKVEAGKITRYLADFWALNGRER